MVLVRPQVRHLSSDIYLASALHTGSIVTWSISRKLLTSMIPKDVTDSIEGKGKDVEQSFHASWMPEIGFVLT